MKPIFIVLTVAVVASFAVGGVVAQENNSTSGLVTTQEERFAGHVGNVQIVSAEIEDGEWVIVLEADTPTQVSVEDPAASMSRLSDSGSGNFDPGSESRQVTVMPNGQTEVRMAAATHDGGHAVYVLANGEGWYTSTGMSSNPFQYFGGMSGLLTGLGLSVVVSGGAAVYVTYGRDPPVRRAE